MLALTTLLFTPGIIPNYLAVKQYGLLNSYASLILPVLVNSAFNLVVLRQFFMNIPGELLDSARIDGANDWDILTKIIIPLSKAVIAVVALFYAVSYWNDFFTALLYLNDSAMWPLQLVLRLYVVQGAPLPSAGDVAENAPPLQSIQMAVVVIAMIPILCVYPFLQRYFTRGVLSGADELSVQCVGGPRLEPSVCRGKPALSPPVAVGSLRFPAYVLGRTSAGSPARSRGLRRKPCPVEPV